MLDPYQKPDFCIMNKLTYPTRSRLLFNLRRGADNLNLCETLFGRENIEPQLSSDTSCYAFSGFGTR